MNWNKEINRTNRHMTLNYSQCNRGFNSLESVGTGTLFPGILIMILWCWLNSRWCSKCKYRMNPNTVESYEFEMDKCEILLKRFSNGWTFIGFWGVEISVGQRRAINKLIKVGLSTADVFRCMKQFPIVIFLEMSEFT